MSTTVQPILAPNSTWFTNSYGITRSSITEITIADTYTPSGTAGTDYYAWDASAAKDGSVTVYVEGTKLIIAGNGYGKIYMNPDSSYVFSKTVSTLADAKTNCFTACTSMNNISLLDSSNVTNMRQAFGYMIALKGLELSGFDVSNVTNMRWMFGSNVNVGIMTITSIDGTENWDTSNVTTMNGMFSCCSSLETIDVSKWNVSNVTDMCAMFFNCESLKTLDVSNWDTSNVTIMQTMFRKCFSLEKLDVSSWNVSKVMDFNNMFAGDDYGVTPWALKELDVSNWDTSSSTNMRYMFYGCQAPGSIDVSKWDVSKVTTFDHMFAHSYLKIGDISNWTTPAATNMNAMFYSVQNTVLDVSNLITSQVICFDQMFESCSKLTKIIGLENFNTSNGLGFSDMFRNCSSLTELDLSSFDTSKAKDGATASANGTTTTTLSNMFSNMTSLKKITLGENFSFNGDGTTTSNAGVLPTPESGYWYTPYRVAYAPADVPSYTAMTYYSTLDAINNILYTIRRGSLLDLADAVRYKTGVSGNLSITDMVEVINGL